MTSKNDISDLIQYHNGIEKFNYDLAIDWAINLIKNGIETNNILILASFSKPVDSNEIKPYVSAVLSDLNLEEKAGDKAVLALIQYYLLKILDSCSIKSQLIQLYNLYLEKDSFDDDKFGLTPFYLLFHAWYELDEFGVNYYFEGVNLSNIEDKAKEQAQVWIDKYTG